MRKGGVRSVPPGGEALRLKFVTDPLYGEHLRGVAHPERPDRVEAVAARLRAQGVLAQTLAGARCDRRRDRARAHRSYVELVERETDGRTDAALSLDRRHGRRRDVLSRRAARRRRRDRCRRSRASRAARRSLRWCVRPAIMPSPTAAWGFASSTTSRLRRARIRRLAGEPRARSSTSTITTATAPKPSPATGLSYVSTHAYPGLSRHRHAQLPREERTWSSTCRLPAERYFDRSVRGGVGGAAADGRASGSSRPA